MAKSDTDGILTAENAPDLGSNNVYKSFRIGVGELAPVTIIVDDQAADVDALVTDINNAIKTTTLINKIKRYSIKL